MAETRCTIWAYTTARSDTSGKAFWVGQGSYSKPEKNEAGMKSTVFE